MSQPSGFQPFRPAPFTPFVPGQQGALVIAQPPASQPGQVAQQALASAALTTTAQIDSFLIVPLTPQELTRGTTALATESMERGGTLSRQSHQELRAKLAEITNQVFGHVLSRVDRVDGILEKYHSDVEKWRGDLVDYSGAVMQDAKKPQGLTQEQMTTYNFIATNGRHILDMMNDTIKNQIESELKGGQYVTDQGKQIIMIALDARKKEIELLRDEFAILKDIETHQSEIALKAMEESMKQQQQLFDQLKDIAKLDQVAYDSYRKDELAREKGQNEHVVKLREVDVAAEKNRLETEAARFSVQLQADVNNFKAASEERIKRAQAAEESRREQIKSNGAVQLEQTKQNGANYRHSKCVVQ